MNLPEIAGYCESTAVSAGNIIMNFYSKDDFSILSKAGNSPVTEADRAANDFITASLREKYPDCHILSEEAFDDKKRLSGTHCFIVDPLDGTKEFISRNGEFTVNIALSIKGRASVGVIYVPVTGELFSAYVGGGACYRADPGGRAKRIYVSDRKEDLVFVCSRSHSGFQEERLLELKRELIAQTVSKGSSLKGCMVAQGLADVYYRFGPTKEWDTAAMQCIVEEAGGTFRQSDGSEMRYNRENPVNEIGFFAVNRTENIWVNAVY